MASLEAKRKYRDPQVNSKQFVMEESISNKAKHMHLDNRASEFFPNKDKCVELDKRASSSVNHSESFVLNSDDCDSVINESADKSFPIVEVACQGGKDISMDRADISKRSYSPDKLGRPFEPNSMRGGENRTILQQEAADENLPHHTMPQSVTIGDYCSEIAIKRRTVFLTQNENEAKPQDVEVKPSEYMETSFSSQEVTWQG